MQAARWLLAPAVMDNTFRFKRAALQSVTLKANSGTSSSVTHSGNVTISVVSFKIPFRGQWVIPTHWLQMWVANCERQTENDERRTNDLCSLRIALRYANSSSVREGISVDFDDVYSLVLSTEIPAHWISVKWPNIPRTFVPPTYTPTLGMTALKLVLSNLFFWWTRSSSGKMKMLR